MNRAAEFHRGWPTLLAAFVGTTLGISGLFFYSLGVFIKPVQAEFGWSRGLLGIVPLVAGLGSTVVSPVFGTLADRFGARLIGCLSLIGLATGFFMLSRTNGSFAFYLAATCVLAVAGAGSSPVVFSRLVTVWFDRARGLALGMAAAGAGVAGIALPRLLPQFVALHGWRSGYAALAVLPLLALPVVALCARDAPPTSTPGALPRTRPDPTLPGSTLREAARTGRFWQMCVAFFLVAMASSGFIVHFIPLLTDSGLSPARAGGIAALTGVAVVCGRLITGLLIDRAHAPFVAATLFAVSALGCVLLATTGARLAPLSALMVGFSFGAEVDVVAFMVGRYFGLRSVGAVFGVQYACFTLGVACGPLLDGRLHDRFGNYVAALLVGAAALAAAAVLTALLGPYPTLRAPAGTPDATVRDPVLA